MNKNKNYIYKCIKHKLFNGLNLMYIDKIYHNSYLKKKKKNNFMFIFIFLKDMSYDDLIQYCIETC